MGAGLAGLACAVDLARAGVDVTVLEARTRVGGRVWSGVMPDGARFERGGEFIEAGYVHFRRRAVEHGLRVVPQGFAFAAREVRSGGRMLPTLLLDAEQVLATTVDALGLDAAHTSAADALARTPLEALARRALRERLEGTYTVELSHVSAAWLSSTQLRAGGSAPDEASARLEEGNEALAERMAAELGERVLLGREVESLRNAGDAVALAVAGVRKLYARVVLAVPLPVVRDRLLTSLRERSSYERLQWGAAAKLHLALDKPAAPAAVQGLETAFWTWTARGPGGAPATIAASFAGGRRAIEALEVGRGTACWRAALQDLRPELVLGERSVLTRWSDDPQCNGSYACHPPGWSVTDDCEIAAPSGRIHLAGEHTAAEFCGTMEGALRSGARAAAEVLATARIRG